MTWFLVKLAISFLVFGTALVFAVKKVKGVKVEPRSMIPLVALVLTALNTLVYWILAPALNLVTLWTIWFLVPFIANGLFVYVTDRFVKPFKIDGLIPLVKTSVIVTAAHLLLRVVDHVVGWWI
jgi:uncharacterized membrane protein YvlD (DUF360 family)